MSITVSVSVTRTLDVDPTDLRPGDVVVALREHDISGCHCDVVVTVQRTEPARDVLDDEIASGSLCIGCLAPVPPGQSCCGEGACLRIWRFAERAAGRPDPFGSQA